MTKKKPKPKRPKLTADELLDRVTLLVVTLLDRSTIEVTCHDELGLSPAKAAQLIDLAALRVTAAATFNRNEQLGRAILRTDDIYQQSMAVKDFKLALAAQRELNHLLLRVAKLYAPGDEPPFPRAGCWRPAGEPEPRQPLTALESLKIIG